MADVGWLRGFCCGARPARLGWPGRFGRGRHLTSTGCTRLSGLGGSGERVFG
ncbi:hypothetical protein ACFPN7_00715 [Amycolatopsis halotolerans]|uniref:hypothetical protein n=1 Tax=Amycolatopsis halotolerans TaxID=330083 RepID=UPI00361FE2CD